MKIVAKFVVITVDNKIEPTMPIKFYLRKRTPETNDDIDLPIIVACSIKGVRIVTTIGYSISEANWNSDAHRVKHKVHNSKRIPAEIINARLSAIESIVSEFEVRLSPDDIPTKDEIKALISSKSGRCRDTQLVTTRLKEFIEKESDLRSWAESTAKKYNTLQKHIEKFNSQIKISQLNSDRLEDYVRFLQKDIGMLDISIKKEIKLLKTFMKWATEKGYNRNMAFAAFSIKVKTPANPVIFLTPDEVKRLRSMTIPMNNEKVTLTTSEGVVYTKIVEDRSTLEKTRDLFLFCCYTGLRYSDMSRVKKTDIKGDTLSIITRKTNCSLKIPLDGNAKELLDKYKGLPGRLALPVITNQQMNVHLKDLCELAGINDPITIVKYYKGTAEEATYPKHDLIGTHAGRRTFVCLALLAGADALTITKITGHKSIEEMRPYIEITDSSKRSVITKMNELLK